MIDAGGITNAVSPPTLSIDTEPNASTCPVDAPSSACSGGAYTGTSCCKACSSSFTLLLGCFSDNDVSTSNLGSSVSKFKDKVPVNTAPTIPNVGVDDTLAMGQRVVIFGCDEVATKTPIVNIPNRAVLSGQSGFYTFKGSVNELFGFLEPINPEQQFTLSELDAIFANAKASLPNKSGLPLFDMCVACLYYAKATRNNTFMGTDTVCGACGQAYCYSATPSRPDTRT